jgi:phasin family protein
MTSDDMRQFGKDGMDLTATSLGAWRRGAEAVAAELTAYASNSIAASSAAWEKVAGAKDLEEVMEVQGEYLKSSYEDFMARTARLGELYVDWAKQACQPFEAAAARRPHTR